MIPKHALDRLKCALCDNSLSIFPIHSYGNKDIVTCGRCSLQKDFLPQREHLYEEVARYIEFPCRYEQNGCIEKLRPADMQSHESSCLHKTCLCPILPLGACKWNGEYRDLSAHCQHIHPNLIFENFLIEVDIINSSEDNYVFCQANETFVAQLKVDTRGHKVYCNVRYCGLDSAAKQFSYRLCFLGKKKKYACQVHSVQAGEVGPILTENTTIADFENILENLHFPVCITCRVDIFVKKLPKEEHEEIAISSEGNSILKKLECPICLDYMVPPIMQCSVGHSFCEWCRNQLDECPTCKSPISATRNYLLEDITTIINYPCKYARFGCKFSGNAQNIKDHEAKCENGPYKCIIENCPWEDRHSKLIAHLNETHKDNILETDVVTHIIDDDLDRESYDYIIIIKGDVFKIEFVRDCFEFTWTLNSVNKTKDCSNFVLLMDFNSEFDERLYMRKRLHPLFLRLDRLQLENFIEDNILSYKIQLIESE